MSRLTSLAAVAAFAAGTLTAAAGCTSETGERPAGAPLVSPTPTLTNELPYFSGALVVRVVPGRPVYNQRGCPDVLAADQVCDEWIGREYRLIGEGSLLTLVEAETQVVDGGLSWAAWLRFDRSDRAQLIEEREQARATGARLVVTTMVDGTDTAATPRLLVAADVPSVDGRVITLTRLQKAQAWQLVRRVVEAD